MLIKRIFLGAAAILAVASAALFAQAADTTAAEPDSAAQPAAILKITTDPPGAAVTINGRKYGPSPIEAAGLEPGAHTIELSKPGHFKRKATIQLDSAGAELHFELNRPATLAITSEPEGARIAVNGKAAGTAPMQKEKMRPGEYKITAAMDGYKKFSATANIASGGADTLHIVLEPKPAEPQPQQQPERAQTARANKKAQEKPSWKTETVLVAFFVFVAVLIGVEKASY